MSVLVVDDDASVLKSVVLFLKRTGWTVQTAMSARTALAMIQKSVPDVILWDENLPDLNGPQLVMSMKCNPATAHVPVLLTGAGGRITFSSGRQDGFLEKPFGPKELLEAIERVAPAF